MIERHNDFRFAYILYMAEYTLLWQHLLSARITIPYIFVSLSVVPSYQFLIILKKKGGQNLPFPSLKPDSFVPWFP